MYACPECHQRVRVRPGAPEGRCVSCLAAARRSAALSSEERWKQGWDRLSVLLGLRRLDPEEDRMPGASGDEGSTPSSSTRTKHIKGGRFGRQATAQARKAA